MIINFSKYQGTGNDFIMLDNRNGNYSNLTNSQVEFLCDRKFGIGADGLILLEEKADFDFNMIYYNSDGNVSSMCGNGGRCITSYANSLQVINGKATFNAIDGSHESLIVSDQPMVVKLKMGDVNAIEQIGEDLFLNTGSPHYVRMVEDVMKVDVVEEARKIRNNQRFKSEGTNVNFVQLNASGLAVRSYERGVEDETLSCGTGITASVLASVMKGKIKDDAEFCEVKSLGGMLKVYFEKAGNGFKNVWLEGEAKFVYSGEIELE
ncbi:MAG: diaminopimelate epimerase [Bacteroidota bacterium]